MNARAIGGFLPLDSECVGDSGGVLSFWGITAENAWMFANARSALAHFLKQFQVNRLILPAYICPEIVSAAGRAMEVAFYPLNDLLSPNIGALTEMFRPGDCVVAVDYFGRAPAPEFREFVASRRDIIWVEDRAQALHTGAAAWAEWVLYSPRKLFGVPDGGILLRIDGSVDAVRYAKPSAEDRVLPRKMRRDDRQECNSSAWYKAYRSTEARMAVSSEPISRYSRRQLGNIDAEWAISRRRRNFDRLAELLPDVAFFDGKAGAFAPLSANLTETPAPLGITVGRWR